MRKAACLSGGVDSLNPRRWRGKRLHHHGGDVCCVFVSCVVVSLVVCKKVPEHNLKVNIFPYYNTIRLIGIIFWPTYTCTIPRHQPADRGKYIHQECA
jgi:hypothetical protein